MRLLSERRYPVAVTAEQARGTEIVLRYWLGDMERGDGDEHAVATLREVTDIMASVRRQETVRAARRAWLAAIPGRARRGLTTLPARFRRHVATIQERAA